MDETLQTAPQSDSEEQPQRHRVSYQVMQVVGAAILLGLLLTPWNVSYYPEGNWLRGPLWLTQTLSPVDKSIGLTLAIPLLTLMALPAGFRNRVAAAVGCLATVAWIAIGGYLAMLAVI